MQCIESVGPFEMSQKWNNRLHWKQQIVQQATTRAQPYLGNDALQLFGNKDASTSARWDYREMNTICGFYNAKMWIKERLAKSNNNNPQFFMCCDNGKILLSSLLATSLELEVLSTNKKRSVVKFRDQIRMYISVLAFTSFCAKVDELVTRGIGPYSFRIHGEFYHKFKSMCFVKG